MERLHWVRHRCRQLLEGNSRRGHYSAHQSVRNNHGSPDAHSAPCLRRVVYAYYGPRQKELQAVSKNYKNNSIHTTKYNLLTFIPMNLFQQFHRIANLYFLFLALLNWVPVVEAFQKEITMIPLVAVLLVIAIKDALEDYQRYTFDKKINNNVVQVFCGAQLGYNEQRWKDVQVGDFVRLTCNEIIPADMLLLYSSDPRGVCSIETSNLDGESNLKQRQVVPGLPLQEKEITPESFHSRIVCENPNNDLRRFRGYIEHADGVRVGLQSSNLLLRSCTVRNTETVIGIVVYTGHETKAIMNNSGPRYKRSQLERRLNTDVLWCVLLLFIMCLTAATGHGLWLKDLGDSVYSIGGETSPALAAFYVFWTMIIVLQVLIPISLYVSIEIVKLGQIYFIHNDLMLYNEQLDARIQCRAMNINEDLGQVQYLFSDKTGTLTENRMVFRRCSIYGVEYPHQEHGRRLLVYEGEELYDTTSNNRTMRSGCGGKPRTCRSLSCSHSSVSLNSLTEETVDGNEELPNRTSSFCSHTEKSVMPDEELMRKMNGVGSALSNGRSSETPSSLELMWITEFFLALTLCNSVVVSSPNRPHHVTECPPSSTSKPPDFQTLPAGLMKDMEGDPDNSLNDELVYEGESPDEAALVHAARAYRFVLLGRSADRLMLQIPGHGSVAVQILHQLPFDSARRRMSVVVRHPFTQQVVVYTKGADSVIMDLAKTPKGSKQVQEFHNHIRTETKNHLDMYAREGLRTLCIAKKILEEEEYNFWLKKQMLAESSIENREELMLDSALRLETDLTLLGSTGVVDRLQEDVPQTVEALQRAGIKLWVLTGDKQETAVSVALACKLLHPDDRLLTANAASKDACAALLQELLLEVQRDGDSWLGLPGGRASPGRTTSFILVIDGQTLAWALQEELSCSFLELSCRCKAVICCRSTPLQKSQVVQLIRTQLGVLTLAVGDGANDVSMIQVADVGIGISGQEGMQAVMASDFAISRFKHLRKLLLVHGHWCFSRLANMILYFIYKNVMYVSLLFWYQFFCGFSGSVMTNSWVLILFNLLFTSVPPIIYGILDQDSPADTLMERPELYRALQTSKLSGSSMFWITVLDAFYQSLICFFVPYFAMAGSDVAELSFASPVNASALLITLIHQILESNTLTWIHASVLLLSAALYWAFVLLFSEFCVTCSPPTNPVGVETLQMSQPLFYIICVLSTVTALLPRLLLLVLTNTVRPSRQQRHAAVAGHSHRRAPCSRDSRLCVCSQHSNLEQRAAMAVS